MNKKSISIAWDLRPEYYDRFQCIGGACRNTCCAGWSITFDRKDYLELKHISGSEQLNQCMEGCLKRTRGANKQPNQYAEFVLKDGICPLLNEEHLCALQLEKGHDALPVVCKEFPRKKNYFFSGYLEKDLSTACEAVLQLLWDLPEGISFVSDPLLPRECRVLTREKGDMDARFCAVLDKYQDLRSLCIDCLQTRALSMPQRILLLGMQLQKVMERPEEIGQILQEFEALLGQAELVAQQLTLPENEKEVLLCLIQHVKTLSRVNGKEKLFYQLAQQMAVQDGQECKFTVAYKDYHAAKQRFEQIFGDLDYFFENLAVHLFFSTGLPHLSDEKELWKGYVNFCNLYSLFRFVAVMTCWEGMHADKETLFDGLVMVSRELLHSRGTQQKIRDEFFENESTSLAHMAVLLSL